MPNKGVVIGLRDVYYAVLTSDPDTGTPTYAAPVKISGAIGAKINPNSSLETLFAEDGPYDTAATLGQISLELNMADIPLSVQQVLLGHGTSGVLTLKKGADMPPWVAIGFRSLKSNGKYRYTWLAKGKFTLPEHGSETKGDRVNFQTPTIEGNFVKRDCDDEWERQVDEDDAGYTSSIGTNWFSSPLGTSDTTALSVSNVVPANAAPSVARNSTIVWTFNKEINGNDVTLENFLVMTQTGTVVAGTIAKTSATTVTFTPTSQMTGTQAHLAIVVKGISDLYGNKLAATSVTTFTTAA